MSDIVERIDAMIEGHAARHGIAINDVVELLSDAKDVLLGLPPEAYKATGGGDNSLSSSISLQSELNKLRAQLAEANAIADLVRQERDVLLKPVMDMTEADSVDDDAQNLMIAYYWLQQCNVARAELAEARDKALDEAAGVAEDHTRNYSPGTFKGLRENMAQAIRALKSPKPQED